MEVWVLENLLKFLGPSLFIGLQISSLQTAYQIYKNKSVQKLSALPFISLFCNCVIWTLYGVLLHDNTVFIPNLTGIFVSIICTIVFHQFCKEKPYIYYLPALLISLLSILLYTEGKSKEIGLIGASLSILVSGSPLAVIKTVIAEQSTAALPFTLSCVLWLNSFSWFAYGYIIVDDIMIYGPNALGFLLSSVQMMLFVIYGFPWQSKLIEK